MHVPLRDDQELDLTFRLRRPTPHLEASLLVGTVQLSSDRGSAGNRTPISRQPDARLPIGQTDPLVDATRIELVSPACDTGMFPLSPRAQSLHALRPIPVLPRFTSDRQSARDADRAMGLTIFSTLAFPCCHRVFALLTTWRTAAQISCDRPVWSNPSHSIDNRAATPVASRAKASTLPRARGISPSPARTSSTCSRATRRVPTPGSRPLQALASRSAARAS